MSGISNPHIPEIVIRGKSHFWLPAELCRKLCAPLRRDLIPNGEAMLADQFVEAVDGARTPAVLDELARKLWRAHAERQIEDADAEAISEAIEARRAVLAGEVTGRPLKAASGPPKVCAAGRNAGLPPERRIEFCVGIQLGSHTAHPEGRGDGDLMGDGVNIAAKRREKMFGLGRPRALHRTAKVRIMPGP
jgi:hypothetical protein